jgi:VIT1/CCC1 family predicted Fe2+/Mn2+ transporter
LPLATAVVAPAELALPAIGGLSLVFLALLGAVAARAGRANPLKGAIRVSFWSALAMVLTAAVGRLFGTIAA